MEVYKPLRFCRYYHGEDSFPKDADQDLRGYWNLERIWVEGVNPYDDKRDQLEIEFTLDFPAGIPSADIPLSLKATIYDQFCHWYGGKDDFVEYLRMYLSFKI